MMYSNPKKPISLQSLEGKWYIQMTNFPMWLKGDKMNPTLNYSIEQKKGIEGLKDRVLYLKNNKEKTILGFDTPLDTSNRKFTWRGQGILALLKSNWEVLYLSSDKNSAIIYFEKTWFTPEGYDALSRKKTMDSSSQKEISNTLLHLGVETKLSLVQHQ